ncbi:MAG: alkaline phosphatase family protein [Alphaproteobacteria bacterium]|nr:alkaline phosphatase family protein [Alphaproteobacteria bacterium]
MRRTLLVLAAALIAACTAEPQPAASDGPRLAPGQALGRIAFASCIDQERPQPIWDRVLDYRPELFVFAGDNVYGDTGGVGPDFLAAAYRKQRGQAGFMAVKNRIPHHAVWDDHDYGKNDGGVEYAHKADAQRQFAEFWNLPADDPRRGREGIYHAAIHGPPGRRVQVVLLDARYFRSALKPTDSRGARGRERYLPDDDPAKTMLGAAQWQWLEAELRKPAELRLIVSGIQVLAEGHGWERWGNLPRERRRLFDLIAATRANGVVFLSGDRHLGALYRETEGVPYPLTEITSSGINRYFPNALEAGPNRLGNVFGQPNFGAIEIDWAAGTVRLSIRDGEGQAQREAVLKLAELAAK